MNCELKLGLDWSRSSMVHAIFLAYMPTGEALKPERDPPGVLKDEPGRRKRLGWAFLVYQAFHH